MAEMCNQLPQFLEKVRIKKTINGVELLKQGVTEVEG